MYLDVLNNDMVGFQTSQRGRFWTISSWLMATSRLRRARDPKKPVESLFKQIQDCEYYYEAGCAIIGHLQQINVGYAKIFATGHFMSACRGWNIKSNVEKTWAQFKTHFGAAHHQHKQMHGDSAATSGYHT
jgi:hypothetical protein